MANFRPTPRPRPNASNTDPMYNQLLNSDLSSVDLYGPMASNNLPRQSHADPTGLPSCVQFHTAIVTAEQKAKDSQLPRLLHELDEACLYGVGDANKKQLAHDILKSASSPISKYRLLEFYQLLENNKEKPNVCNALAGALVILEKYATNLLKREKHHLWRVVRFDLDIIQKQLVPVAGALHVLQQMGYTNTTKNTLTFPMEVQQPDVSTVVVLASDLVIARFEVDTLFKNNHPFLTFCPTRGVGNQYDVAERRSPANAPPKDFCGVCSEQNVATFCRKCDMKFCNLCDERWHRHVLRRTHSRSNLVKPEEIIEKPKRPVPVPRRRKNQQDPPISSSLSVNAQEPHRMPERTSSPANITPSQPEIKRPPPRSSPTSMNQSHVSGANFGQSPPLNQFMPSSLEVTPPERQSRTRQDTQMGQSEQYQQNTFAGTQMTSKDTVISCPKCSMLVSLSNPTCLSCGQPIAQLSPSSDPTKSSLGMATPVTYQQGGYDQSRRSDRLQMFTNFDNARNTKLGVSGQPFRQQQLPELPRQPPTAPYEAPESEGIYEEIDQQAAKEWNCEHCTFTNPVTTKICMACSKTPSDLKNHPSTVAVATGSKNQQQSNERIVPCVPIIQEPFSEGLFMTPKSSPLEGGIYMAPTYPPREPPALPKKVNHPANTRTGGGGVPAPQGGGEMTTPAKRESILVKNAQQSREQELSEKEIRKKLYKEKEELYNKGLISEGDFNDPGFSPPENIGAHMNQRIAPELDQEKIRQLLETGQISYGDVQSLGQVAPPKPSHTDNQDLALSDDQLLKLINEGGFSQEEPTRNMAYQRNPQRSNEPTLRYQEDRLTQEERTQLYEAGVLSQAEIYERRRQQTNQAKPMPQACFDDMMQEFQTLQCIGLQSDDRLDQRPNRATDYHNYHVTRDLPRPFPQGFPDKTFVKNYGSDSQDSPSSFMSLPSQLENRGTIGGTYGFLEDQGRMYIKWLKQAETFGFTAEELNLSVNLSWQDPKGRDPVQWLKEEWSSRTAAVIGQVTERTTNENDRIGNISTEEAREALVENHGSVESACKACIEGRREKLAKMSEIAVYGRADCLNALDKNNGNLDNALLELEMKALDPIRRRVLGTEDGQDGGRVEGPGQTEQKFNDIVANKAVSAERRARIIFAEKNLMSWGRAETAVKLIDQDFTVADSIEAAKAYGDMERSLRYLQQECPVCMDIKPMGQMITYLNCQDRICRDCITEYLTSVIKEKNIHHLVCPVCDQPDLTDETEATGFFNNLDIMVREFVDEEVHDLFQQKLRDRTLSREPNFRWCAHCAFGFINEVPNVNKMVCPACKKYTCFECKKQWEVQHDGISCEEFARWKEENDEEYQQEGLAGHLARHGIDCPQCKFRYDLARGGCMHFKCIQCTHEFCSGCFNPIKRGAKCRVSPNCARKGLHAHHPRDCLFYLRDWTPNKLQQLLDRHGVDYRTDERERQEDEEDEVVGAVGGQDVARVCRVLEQKETMNGLQDAECGAACEDGHEGLCKVHYKEYLVGLINRNAIDPAELMDIEDLVIVLNRSEVAVPARQAGEDEDIYKDRILDVLRNQLPLGREIRAARVQEEQPRFGEIPQLRAAEEEQQQQNVLLVEERLQEENENLPLLG